MDEKDLKDKKTLNIYNRQNFKCVHQEFINIWLTIFIHRYTEKRKIIRTQALDKYSIKSTNMKAYEIFFRALRKKVLEFKLFTDLGKHRLAKFTLSWWSFSICEDLKSPSLPFTACTTLHQSLFLLSFSLPISNTAKEKNHASPVFTFLYSDPCKDTQCIIFCMFNILSEFCRDAFLNGRSDSASFRTTSPNTLILNQIQGCRGPRFQL